MTQFWKGWSEKNLQRKLPHQQKHQEQQKQQDHREDIVPISLGDPEQEWEKYAAAFNSSDLDRIVIEEQAKVQAGLRMVFDKATGDIVTLDEFELRVRLRELSEASTDTVKDCVGVKRKANTEVEAGEILEGDNKRVCL